MVVVVLSALRTSMKRANCVGLRMALTSRTNPSQCVLSSMTFADPSSWPLRSAALESSSALRSARSRLHRLFAENDADTADAASLSDSFGAVYQWDTHVEITRIVIISVIVYTPFLLKQKTTHGTFRK